MKKLITAFALFFSIVTTAQSQSAYFLSNPTLTPDGQTVIFSFEGDLWKANVNNGQASRLMKHRQEFLPMASGSHLPEGNMEMQMCF